MSYDVDYDTAVKNVLDEVKDIWEDLDPCLIFSCKDYVQNYEEMNKSIKSSTYSRLKNTYPKYAERYKKENNI